MWYSIEFCFMLLISAAIRMHLIQFFLPFTVHLVTSYRYFMDTKGYICLLFVVEEFWCLLREIFKKAWLIFTLVPPTLCPGGLPGHALVSNGQPVLISWRLWLRTLQTLHPAHYVPTDWSLSCQPHASNSPWPLWCTSGKLTLCRRTFLSWTQKENTQT